MYTSLMKLVTDVQEYEAPCNGVTATQIPYSATTSNTPVAATKSTQQPAGLLLMSSYPGRTVESKTPSTPATPTVQKANEGEDQSDDASCKICLDSSCECVFMPCGHVCACVNCAAALRMCPICRARIESIVKFYR